MYHEQQDFKIRNTLIHEHTHKKEELRKPYLKNVRILVINDSKIPKNLLSDKIQNHLLLFEIQNFAV